MICYNIMLPTKALRLAKSVIMAIVSIKVYNIAGSLTKK